MKHIENRFILSEANKHTNKITLYNRYVDDTFMMLNGNKRQLELLLTYLNSLAPNLKFTLDIEKDKILNFLDMVIEKKNNKLSFKIYGKPSTSSHTIYATSYHRNMLLTIA